MARRAILHIGTEKTGTTTLQGAFRYNADLLVDQRVRFPLLGGVTHGGLVVCVANEDREVADLHGAVGWERGEPRDAFCERFAAALASEVERHPDSVFVFSTEHAHSRLVSEASVSRLKTLLDRHFDIIEIVVYLRRWDRMVVSFESTQVLGGDTRPFSFERLFNNSYLDFRSLLERWSAAFGMDRMHVGTYDRRELVNGSIVDDFTSRMKLPQLERIPDANKAVAPGALGVLRLLNRLLASRDADDARRVRQAIVSMFPSVPADGPLVGREQARAFVARFADQAEAIRARYFPDRDRLFSDDFDEYPVDADATTAASPTWRDVTLVAVDALATALRREQVADAAASEQAKD